ncbi:conserved hypothetical protein [Theileria equi strain WA]|uniref:Uncharacterized protein n=1 Tax=Theileria equi strain WA TaxID=1537102 RepID=L1LAF6_THEEQ|nr:conserved hypothetical protein [Theileria equi strain WA]EKX72457.1 conserved hypothetical protein [Theileria equi strain WA]|eukprot:XP_004831909.1 conserved hypothetical protein [Theileria equi strain WA]
MDRGNVRGRRQGNSDRDRRSPERSRYERYTESHVEKDDGKWKHDLYESDGERAAYEADLRAQKQNTGYVVDTRKGARRSRAGGVYLAPKEDVDEDLYEHRKRNSGR